MMYRIRRRLSSMQRLVLLLALVLFSHVEVAFAAASLPSATMILRVRLPDGSVQKLAVDADSTDKVSLQDTLRMLAGSSDNCLACDDDNKLTVQTQTNMQSPTVDVEDSSQTLAALGLKHGSLVTLRLPKSKGKEEESSSSKISRKASAAASATKTSTWNPFPELAKDYDNTTRRLQNKQRRNRGNYADLVNQQAQLHLVEPQAEGYLKRIYMCRTSAERFRNACVNTKSRDPTSTTTLGLSVGLLLGTVARERVDLNRKRAKTSLSSTTEREEFCQVAKVQTLVAFPNPMLATGKKDDNYDASRLLSFRSDEAAAAAAASILRVADWLGLRPVGWIFLYNDDRLEQADTLPVLSCDVQVAARLQAQEMKAAQRSESAKAFCTLAMDVKSGATDAFQLSDVCVQMQAEGLLDTPHSTQKIRPAHTKHPVLVDGQEVTEFDSVLCLVNTALLSHDGNYAGTNSVKKNGTLTKKAKKALLQALDAADDGSLLGVLSDFNLLVALDEWLGREHSEALCKAVSQYTRGLKRSTSLDQKLKDRIRDILETH